MKRLLHIVLLSVALVHCAVSQGIIQPEWSQRKSSIIENGNAEAWGIGFDQNGDIFWAVNREGSGFLQGLDIYLYKLDAGGNEIWSNPTVVEGQHAQQIYTVTVTDTTVYMGGRNCTQFTLDPDLPFCDMFLAAVGNKSGEIDWTFDWDRGFGYEEIDGLEVHNNAIFVSGWSFGESSDMDLAVLKLDGAGQTVWENAWGTDGRDHQDGHVVVDDDYIYMAGLLNGPVNPGLCLVKDYNGQALLARFSRETGQYDRHVVFGRDDFWCNFENVLGMTSDGEYLFLVGVTTPEANNTDIFVAKYDKELRQIWYTTWGGNGTESSRAITVGSDGFIYVGGNTNSFGAGDFDVALLKFSTSGGFLGYKTWGDAGEDQVLDIDSQGSALLITGKSNSFSTSGRPEAVLLNVDITKFATARESDLLPQPEFEVTVFPNPFRSSTEIEIRTASNHAVTVSIYDLLGREIMRQQLDSDGKRLHRFQWNPGNTLETVSASGLYLIRATNGTSDVTRPVMWIR